LYYGAVKSTSGAHFIALDHVRALAAFMVITWHFIHAAHGFPIPFSFVPSVFPLSLLDEGHTGVALFMTLSGYLFAKLIDGRAIDFGSFIYNRMLRLLPLLIVVIILVGCKLLLKGQNLNQYVVSLASGLVFPTLPNGGWSITVEFHFYLLLPLFHRMQVKTWWFPLAVVLGAILIRLCILLLSGEVQQAAYSSILGRIDQFAFGILMARFRLSMKKQHWIACCLFLGFAWFYWWFDNVGGFTSFPKYPSPSVLWVFLPSIEGITYALLIAWYDTSFSHSTGAISNFIGTLGQYSYSIYLLHFFVVFEVAKIIDKYIANLSNFYVAVGFSFLFFALMVIPGYLSFKYIESPFLKLRKPYVKLS
jgi:peptidoglycan/LPS O-acetylase OafA/YrhL